MGLKDRLFDAAVMGFCKVYDMKWKVIEIAENAEQRSERNKELKKAKAEFYEDIPISVRNYIANMDKASEVVRGGLLHQAIGTSILVAYALYYMTNKEAKLISVEEKEATLINAVADYLNFGIIYEKYPIGNIMDYDISTGGTDNFILSIVNLEKRTMNKSFQTKMLTRKTSLKKLKGTTDTSQQEWEERKTRERLKKLETSREIYKWEPFCSNVFIGFRRLSVRGFETYLDCLEFINDKGKCYYIYNNKRTYKGGYGSFHGEHLGEGCPEKYQFIYSPKALEELTYALELTMPRFRTVDYIIQESERICFGITKALQQDFSIADYEMELSILREEEVELLSDDILEEFCKKCRQWKAGSYSQYFEPKAYEIWRKRLESVGAAAEKEWINRAEKQEQAKQEAQKQMEAQLREEELKGKQEAGNAGEQEVEYQLKWLPKEYMAVEKKTSGILLAHPDFGNEKQEIDHIVVGPQGVFLIETKAYSGTIRIDAQGNWTRSKGDGVEEGLRNPVAQVNRHHLVVEKILGISEIYDIICIANDKSIIEGAENSVVPVVKSDMLGHYISNYKKDSDKRYNEEEVKELKAKLESSMLENEA